MKTQTLEEVINFMDKSFMHKRPSKIGPLGHCWAVLSLLAWLVGPVAEVMACGAEFGRVWNMPSCWPGLVTAKHFVSGEFRCWALTGGEQSSQRPLWKPEASGLAFPWVLSFLVLDLLTLSGISNCVWFLTLVFRVPVLLPCPASWLNFCHLLHSVDGLSSLKTFLSFCFNLCLATGASHQGRFLGIVSRISVLFFFLSWPVEAAGIQGGQV